MTLLAAGGIGQPVEWLAVAGGAALGAFVLGLAAQVGCRGATRKKLPPLPLLIVRILGGVVAGVLTAMFVLTGGGNGWWPFGGPGGGNNPSASGTTANNEQKPAPDQNNPPQPQPPNHEATIRPTSDNSMTVEVLTGQEFMKRKQEDPKIASEERYYRLPDSNDPKALHSLKEVEDAIQGRSPKRTVQFLIIFGPDRSAGWVAPLKNWAEARGIQVE